MSSRFRRPPSLSVSVKDVKDWLSPTFLTKRPFFAISGRPSLAASASFTSRIVAVLGTATCTCSSSRTACFTVTCTSCAGFSGGSPAASAVSASARGSSSPAGFAGFAGSGSWAGALGRSSRSNWLSTKPLRWNSSSSLKALKACIICITPFVLPSKPYLGRTMLCTVRKSFWRSTLNWREPRGCAVSRSTSLFWNSSRSKPSRRSIWRLKACPLLRLGTTPAAALRSSTPTSSRLRRLPSFSASLKDVSAPPARRTNRAFAETSGRPSFLATASFTSCIVAESGTATRTSSSVVACLTVTSTAAGPLLSSARVGSDSTGCNWELPPSPSAKTSG